jgi:hypothetical protein
MLRSRLGIRGVKISLFETRDCGATTNPDYSAEPPEIVEVW